MKKTILVVDNFIPVRNYVCESLNKKGYFTIGVKNGNEAFSVLKDKMNQIHLVLTDYFMQDWTGIEFLKKIKSDPLLSAIPVVFLTTQTNPDKIEEAKAEGLSDWIKKPYRSETFFAQIDKAIL